jgi:phosphatidylinositol glycan class B
MNAPPQAFPPWNFVAFNLLGSGAAKYGTHPWHWYLSQVRQLSLSLPPSFPLSLSPALSLCPKGLAVVLGPLLLPAAVGLCAAWPRKALRFLPAVAAATVALYSLQARRIAARALGFRTITPNGHSTGTQLTRNGRTTDGKVTLSWHSTDAQLTLN